MSVKVSGRKPKKALLLLLAVALVLAALLVKGITGYFSRKNGTVTEEQMRAFLEGYGWVAGNTPQCKEIVIPAKFTEVYQQYNEIQISQGYDLSKYRTETVLQYTFPILNFTDSTGAAVSGVEAHILVRGGEIIGGDLCSASLSGFLSGFSGE